MDEWKNYERHAVWCSLRTTQKIRVYGAPELEELDRLKIWVKNWNMHRSARGARFPPGYEQRFTDLEDQSPGGSLYSQRTSTG